MEWIAIVVAVLFILLGVACIALVLVTVPGTWIMIVMALVIEWADRFYLPVDDRQTFSWWVIGTCIALAAFGELLEFIAGALGAKTGGSSRRGMIGALLGGIIGAIVGVGIPIPIVGSLIGAAIGAFVGAVAGEMTNYDRTAKDLPDTLKPAAGAAIGRVLGTLLKLPVAMAVWAILSVSIVV